MRRIKKILLWTACCAVLLSSQTGCVYWRLHQFRNQMSSFPDYYRIEERALPTIVALRPILQPDDLGWLTGLPASETRSEGELVVERYHYVKAYGDPADDEGGQYDHEIHAHFNADGKLRMVEAPSRFAPLLTEKNFEEVFGPMKDGAIDRSKFATGWSWDDHRVNIPTRVDTLHFFGVPHEIAEDGMTYFYRYQLAGNDVRWNPTDWDLYIRFVFEPEEERVVYAEVYMGRLHLLVDLRAEKNTVEIKRL